MTGEDIQLEELCEARYDVPAVDDCDQPYEDSCDSAAISSEPKIEPLFDLADMGVVQMGGWDSTGMAVNWIVTPNQLPVAYPSFMNHEPVLRLMPGPDYGVQVRGIYSKYLTNERRAAMGLQPV